MRAKSLFLLAIALGCGLVASIGITQVMATRNAAPHSLTADTTPIFVALQDIPVGEPLTAQLVKLESWPKDRVPPGSLTKLDEVEGRRPKTKLYAGEPILDNKLLTKGESNAGASMLIPKGYRVVPVKVDMESGGASLILPGDRVDVLVHLKRSTDIHETATRTILQDVKVFAVDDVYNINSQDQKAISAKTISLLLTPSQAEKVCLATELGKIRLVMRNAEDKDQAPVEGVVATDLFQDGEHSDREKDSTLMGLLKQGTEPNKDFFALLKPQQPPAAPALPEIPAGPTWTVRTIHGPTMREVVLQQTDASDSGAESKRGFSLWKMISGGQPPTSATAKADSASAVVQVGGAKPASPSAAGSNQTQEKVPEPLAKEVQVGSAPTKP
jgi:pilus assembly protein CpaB